MNKNKSSSPLPFISTAVFIAQRAIFVIASMTTLYPLTAVSEPAETASTQAKPVQTSEAIIQADRQGHFRGTVLINKVAMPFLIDTGATKTIIPTKLAVSAKLPYGKYTQASTAGGKVSQRETTIKTLEIGAIKLQNLDAQLNDHLEVVLIGMNALKQLNMTQNGNTMTLATNEQPTIESEAANVETKTLHPDITNIKKTVVCDTRNICTTKYSDR